MSYGWNWRSVRAIGTSLGSLVLPMPLWMRIFAVRGVLARTALRADTRGIAGNCGPLEVEPDGHLPWRDITYILVWKFNYLTIVAVARRDDPVAGAWTTDDTQAPRERGSRKKQEAVKRRRTRRKSHRNPEAVAKSLSFPPLMTPDGTPSDPGRLITVTGQDVNVGLLTAVTRRIAPGVRIVDLTHHVWIPADLDLGPDYTPAGVREIADVFDYVKTLLEILHLPVRRLLWTLGIFWR